jgi:serine/threonine protein kinase
MCFSRSRRPNAVPVDLDKIRINVGGEIYTMSVQTILRYKSPVLRKVLDNRNGKREVFIDRDGTNFRQIAEFMRDGPDRFRLPNTDAELSQLRHEASCLELQELVSLIDLVAQSDKEQDVVVKEENKSNASFEGAPIPQHEAWRLARLRETGVLQNLGTPEHRYDSITRAVASLLNMPICLVSLVDDEYQWFKSNCGLAATNTERKSSFCAFTLVPEETCSASMFVVEDAHLNPLVKENPLVTGAPFIRFYAGCPLVGWDGVRYGALCIIDQEPRTLRPNQAMLLTNFAQLVVQEIERSQLLRNYEYGEVHTLETPSAFAMGFNFECGNLRAWRMRQALSEAIILVWAPENSADWSIVYGNEGFFNMTGLCIKPSAYFPHASIALANGTAVGNSLFDLMTFDGDVQKLSQHDHVTPFSIYGTLSIRNPGSHQIEKRMNVTCRFNPAALPVDANAAVVRPVPMGDGICLSEPFEMTDKRLTGQLYFVTMHVRKTESNQKGQEAIEYFSAKALEKYHTEGAPVRNLALSKRQSVFVKPPPSPFEDVQILHYVGGRSSAPQVLFSLWSGYSVAVKVITHKEISPEIVTTVLSSELTHPNIVSSYKFQTQLLRSDPRPVHLTWIVQEWCDGGTFSEYCCIPRYDTKQGLVEMLGALWEIACGATYLHSKGIVHDDMTGNHILLRSYDSRRTRRGYRCKLCNFGFSCFYTDHRTEPSITSLPYMPPERYAASNPTLTTKNDVWSFGVLVWQAMTGQVPYKGFSYLQVAKDVANGHRLQLPSASDELAKEVLRKCTMTDPESRPTMNEITDTLMERMKRENCHANIRVGYWRRSRTP